MRIRTFAIALLAGVEGSLAATTVLDTPVSTAVPATPVPTPVPDTPVPTTLPV